MFRKEGYQNENAQFFCVFPHPAGREHTGKNVEPGNTKGNWELLKQQNTKSVVKNIMKTKLLV